ncbi:MAG: hypothetical protein M0Q44_18610 [Methylobacter sp.]|jgi:hypothetical protein|nr:hypothetical protein [Methylobacter sp.]
MSEDILIAEKKRFQLEEAILVLLLILSLVGIGITDFSPADGYGYWIIMVLLFGLFAMIIGWQQSKHRSDDFKIILREQSIHWATSLLVVGGAFLILQSGRIAEAETGLIILLILSLSTILDGLRVGWRFSLVGLFLGVAAVVSVYTPHFLWVELGIAILIVAATVSWELWIEKKAQS